ncbi:MAG: ABC transporter ATP-binding protein [Caldilineaceae bacterium]|nr:ABC transporter ATP-binding protein [Caldilineaceae bacterium]
MSVESLLHLQGVRKSFGAVTALHDVDLQLLPGQVHGLLGGNGAGKTTLMNIVYGLYRPDAGTILLNGQPVEIRSPRHAIDHGIGMVHQHFLQIPTYSVTQNVVLGSRLNNWPALRLAEPAARIRELSSRFGLAVDPWATIEGLPMGVRQRVEILKALYRGVRVLILDEPTTNLTPQEVDQLFESLRLMVRDGMSVVFITHKLREAMSVCDTITVLREGRHILTEPGHQMTEERIVNAMVGGEVPVHESLQFASDARKAIVHAAGKQKVFQVSDLEVMGDSGAPAVRNVSFDIHAGEILGVAGVAGNGQVELLEGLLNIRPYRGRVMLDGKDLGGRTTGELLAAGIAYVPEDRLQDGFLPRANVAQNLILGYQRRAPYSRNGMLNWRTILSTAQRLIQEYQIRTQGPKETAANLSGGNIQRVMLARAFEHPRRLLMIHNPTSGLDIPSVEAVYRRLVKFKEAGMAILLVSDDLDELLLLSDRLGILYRGELVRTLQRHVFDKYAIGRYMSGVKEHV